MKETLTDIIQKLSESTYQNEDFGVGDVLDFGVGDVLDFGVGDVLD